MPCPLPRLAAAFALALPLAAPAAAQPWPQGARLEFELGGAWTLNNDVRIPNPGGTRFDLQRLTGEGPDLFGRATLDYDWGRHGLRGSYQPLRTGGTGTLPGPTLFAGSSFAGGVPTEGRYRFDTWRLTYRYTLWEGESFRLRLGVTALVRDALVELRQGATRARDTDLGFVPLLHAAAEWRLAPRWTLLAEADALAAPQGRAIDLALRAAYDLSDRWQMTGGLRMLEGGADNGSVYSFGWFLGGTAGVAARF
ncbi:MAG: hypothetical protein N2Z67_00300 [Acetobacteraceae bacterium]|nr:hypothetical protein [Acetobacteraceae bacterium]